MTVQASLGAAALCLVMLAACTVTPKDPVDAQAAADANANLGIDFMHKGQYQAALQRLQRALSYEPDHVRANWAMALVSMRLQDYDSADRHFRRAIAARPAPDILNDYGVFLCQRGHSDKALNYFRQAATNPRYAQAADAWTNAGVCLARAHRGKEAAGYLRKALATDPKQGQALAQLARLRFQAGDYLAARGFLQRCDAVTPLQGDLLLLAARNELALGEANEARAYLHRYNSGHPGQTITMEQLTDKKHGG